MKYLVGLARNIVGFLFIISGLVKLNDPVGFAFKLQDYFAPEVLDLPFFIPFALPMAIFMVVLEIVLGVFLILGILRKFTLWALMLMIVFFTFLTFYSAYFNKVTDCGCFGDAIPLTPWESFAKDVILLLLIIILFLGKEYIRPIFTTRARSLIVLVTFVFSFALGYYVLQHLPVVDFRAYKVGVNIKENMIIPEDAPKPVYEYKWKFNINGDVKIITTKGDYPDVEGEFIDVDTKLLKEGYTPPIHDFTIEKEGEDLTDQMLDEEHLVVVIAYSLLNTDESGYAEIKKATDRALDKGYRVIGLSASSDALKADLIARHNLNFDFYFCDETTLKTIVRSNPGILELQKGTIIQKFHWNDAHKLKLKELPKKEQVSLDSELKQKLDAMLVQTEKYDQMLQTTDHEQRVALGQELGLSEAEALGDVSAFQAKADQVHMHTLEEIFETHGYPGKTLVGTPTNEVAVRVLQRFPEKIITHLSTIKEAGRKGEIPMTQVAILEDTYLMSQHLPQIYGTQGYIDTDGTPYIWPIDNAEQVNQRRAEAGFENSVEDYAKSVFGEDFVYRPVTIEDIK